MKAQEGPIPGSYCTIKCAVFLYITEGQVPLSVTEEGKTGERKR